LRPDRFAAAATACVIAAHSSVDSASFLHFNGFNISAVVAASSSSQTIVVIQKGHSNSIGDIIAYSENESGYSPLVLSSFSKPSAEEISECSRAQRVGGWVLVHVLSNSHFRDLLWIADLIPADITSPATLDDHRRPFLHSQFRLWIISHDAESVPPNILEVSHIILHDMSTRSFASSAAAAVEAASSIRNEISSSITSTQHSSIIATALLHALFSFKNSCSASLTQGNYDAFPSIPAMRVQISNSLAFSRATAGFSSYGSQLPVSQRGRARTPNSQAPIITGSPTTSAVARSEFEERAFLQVLFGGCGLLIGCRGLDERKRFESLAENVLCSNSSSGFTSASVIASLSLPPSLIIAAETGDNTAVIHSMPSEDSDCAALGPDVQRVLALQHSCRIVADIATLSASWLHVGTIQNDHTSWMQIEPTERCMSLMEPGAPLRPNVIEDFLCPDAEIQSDASLRIEPEATSKTKFSHISAQLNGSEVDQNLKSHSTMIASPTRPLVNAVLLSLHEIMLALPVDIGDQRI
jgi:hypothetical protein